MVTASHNPHYDNGLKIISAEGGKLEPADEYLIESFISEFTHHHIMPEILHQDQPKYIKAYLENLSKHFDANFLKGLKVVTDLANGATAQITPLAFKHFGANVLSINKGDGLINEQVGSEFTAGLARKVVDEKADIGLAHDGDGDRVIFIDKKGKKVDGDKILGLLAIHAKKNNNLKGTGFVATIHSNSGLASTLKECEIELHRSDVGDRNVFGMMRETGSNWGGESSGHIICTDYMNTGDGLFSALSILKCVQESQDDLFRLSSRVSLWPSRSVAIKVTSKKPIEGFSELQEFLRETKEAWGEDTRILIRYSGTEPKIRVLVEARDEKVVDEVFLAVQNLIKKHI
jgi:phosphoglucosamine mutase